MSRNKKFSLWHPVREYLRCAFGQLYPYDKEWDKEISELMDENKFICLDSRLWEVMLGTVRIVIKPEVTLGFVKINKCTSCNLHCKGSGMLSYRTWKRAKDKLFSELPHLKNHINIHIYE